MDTKQQFFDRLDRIMQNHSDPDLNLEPLKTRIGDWQTYDHNEQAQIGNILAHLEKQYDIGQVLVDQKPLQISVPDWASPRVKERVVYTDQWLWNSTKNFFRDVGRSLVFGLIILFSFVVLIGIPMWCVYYANLDIDYENIIHPENIRISEDWAMILGIAVALPFCVFLWWAALDVADDRRWDKTPYHSIWENQQARWIESSIKYAQYLESKGESVDMSLVLSDNVYATAHKLIDHTDEATLSILVAALLANAPDEVARSVLRSEESRLIVGDTDIDQTAGEV